MSSKTRLGDAITDGKCNDLRAMLERMGGDPSVIEAAVTHLRNERSQSHCGACGTFLVERGDGTRYPCVSCTTPRKPWPSSRQGYRPVRRR